MSGRSRYTKGQDPQTVELVKCSLATLGTAASTWPLLVPVVSHLQDRMGSPLSPDQFTAAACEVAVAAWLARSGRLESPPGFKPAGGDPILDLGCALAGDTVGVEVKHDADDAEALFLSGKDERDVALRSIIERRYGPGLPVTFKWHDGGAPPPEDWGRMRLPLLQAVEKAVLEAGDIEGIPDGQRLLIKASVPEGSGRLRGFKVEVGWDLPTTVAWEWAADGWGIAADRIGEHARRKATKLAATGIYVQFLLVYCALPGERRHVTAARLPWAWQELASDPYVPKSLMGVVCLSLTRADGGGWAEKAIGVLRGVDPVEELRLRDDLGVKELSSTDRRVRAAKVWEDLRRDMRNDTSRINEGRTRSEWDALVCALESTGPSGPRACDLWQRSCILAANNGVKVPALSLFSSFDPPFPCSAETLLTPRGPAPRR